MNYDERRLMADGNGHTRNPLDLATIMDSSLNQAERRTQVTQRVRAYFEGMGYTMDQVEGILTNHVESLVEAICRALDFEYGTRKKGPQFMLDLELEIAAEAEFQRILADVRNYPNSLVRNKILEFAGLSDISLIKESYFALIIFVASELDKADEEKSMVINDFVNPICDYILNNNSSES